jgi:hypothetical protein
MITFAPPLPAKAMLDRDPLDLVERNLILSPVVKLGRPRALVVCHFSFLGFAEQ